MSRRKAGAEVDAKDAELGEVLRRWYNKPVVHLWRNAAGWFEKITSCLGFDQGCQLAAASYSIAQAKAIHHALEQMKQRDAASKIYSYLDDTYVVIKSEHAEWAVEVLQKELDKLGLELNPRKTLVWSPAGAAAVSGRLAGCVVQELPVLGAYMRAPGDTQEAPHLLGAAQSGLDVVTGRLGHLYASLKALQKEGLKKQAVAALLHGYAGSASQHALRQALVTEAEASRYDDKLRQCWADLAERPLDQTGQALLGIPAKLGGIGAQYAEDRRYAAYFSSWSAAASEVADDLGCSTVADALSLLPEVATKLEQARQGLAGQGVKLSEGATLADALGHPTTQSLVMEKVQKIKEAALLQRLPLHQSADVRGAGGPGSNGFLTFPSEAVCSIEDADWTVALRQRLRYSRAECAQHELTIASTTCCLTTKQELVCGEPLDSQGFHSCTCQCGGGILRRHKRTAKGVGSLISRWSLVEPLYEQRVPSCDRPSRSQRPGRDPIERAILDIEYPAEDGRMWLDITVRHPAAGDTAALHTAARRNGEASRRGEREKHSRYPGERLVPFALECGGRMGGEARQWLRAQVSELPSDVQNFELRRAYKVVSCSLQGQIARQLRKAAGLR